ncbi:hypothetical protein EV140_0035 [Microcella alkaliphila]|uniref:Lipoprotein n=1 Tax=Microcella alkaliphila TaxID=279828 RepID=A0A4Q7TZG3_9MICO|nr:hypothetical protein [Microcella alkaliphila]RZT66495.1 hypothetical protein EV140_0035 [Microcella alkaliphila]
MRVSVRTAVVSVVFCMVAVLGGCSGVESESPEPGASSTPGAIEVEEQIFTVDVTLARSLLDPARSLTDEEIISGAADNGISAAVAGDEVVYTLTKAQRDEMLTQMRSSAQEAIDEMVADDSNSVTGVDFNEEMTSFEVSVDGARFAPLEGLLVLGFYVQGALYQQFDGVPVDEVDVLVEFVDDTTGEVLETGSYQEMRTNLGQ